MSLSSRIAAATRCALVHPRLGRCVETAHDATYLRSPHQYAAVLSPFTRRALAGSLPAKSLDR